MAKRKLGKITMEPGARPEPHELDTINYLAKLGRDIIILEQIPHPGMHKPDIRMCKVEWEIKSPTGKSSNNIKRTFKVAIGQSDYLIFDLRRSPATDAQNTAKLLKEFHDIKKVKQMLVITKTGEMLDFKK